MNCGYWRSGDSRARRSTPRVCPLHGRLRRPHRSESDPWPAVRRSAGRRTSAVCRCLPSRQGRRCGGRCLDLHSASPGRAVKFFRAKPSVMPLLSSSQWLFCCRAETDDRRTTADCRLSHPIHTQCALIMSIQTHKSPDSVTSSTVLLC